MDLKLFDALDAGPQDVAALSPTPGAAPQSLRILLDAPVTLGFITRQAYRYTLTAASSAFLLSSQPTYLGALVAHNAMSAAVFDVCKDYRRVVTEGYRLDPWAYSTGSNERVVHLTRGLFTLGYPAAQAIEAKACRYPPHSRACEPSARLTTPCSCLPLASAALRLPAAAQAQCSAQVPSEQKGGGPRVKPPW